MLLVAAVGVVVVAVFVGVVLGAVGVGVVVVGGAVLCCFIVTEDRKPSHSKPVKYGLFLRIYMAHALR